MTNEESKLLISDEKLSDENILSCCYDVNSFQDSHLFDVALRDFV